MENFNNNISKCSTTLNKERERGREGEREWLIDSLLFDYGSFISFMSSLHESRIEIEENTVGLVDNTFFV